MARRKRQDVASTIEVPEYLRRPVIELDPGALESERQYQAFRAWREYTLTLYAWAHENKVEANGMELNETLGTTYDDFAWIAKTLPD